MLPLKECGKTETQSPGASSNLQLESSGNNVSNATISLASSKVKGNINVTGKKIVYNKFKTYKVEPVVTSFRLIATPVSNFTGRENIISQIHHRFNECSLKTRFDERIVVLHGFGGIGKSETARKYVEKHIKDPIIQNVAWIDSESEKSLKASFVSLAKSLKLDIPKEDDKRDAQEISQDVYQHFSAHVHHGLLIFDNSLQMKNPDKYFGICKYLPTQLLDNCPLILITARTSEWKIPKENIINIQELDKESSIKFLREQLNLTEAQRQNKSVLKSIQELALAMQGYPLGLTLAASNICNDEWNDLCTEIEMYLKRMELPTEERKWVEDTLSEGDPNTYPLIMANVWKATLEKIQSIRFGEEAIKALKIRAYMPPENIELWEVEKIYKFIYDKEMPKECFSILSKYSLILTRQRNYLDRMITIHRLVQHYTRTKQQEEKDDSIVIHYCMYLSQKKHEYKQLRGIFVYLKAYWPSNASTILFCILFCSGYTEKLQKKIQNPLRILFEYFLENDDQHFMLAKERMEENEVKLIMMSLSYYLDFRSGYFGDDMRLHDYRIDKQPIKNFVMTIYKSFVEYLLQPFTIIQTEDQTDVILKNMYTIFYEMLINRHNEKPTRPFKEPIEFLAELIDSGKCGFGRKETARQIFNLLAIFYTMSKNVASSFEIYLNCISKVHKNVFLTVDQNSRKDMEKYWKWPGPIDYDVIPELDSLDVVRLFQQNELMLDFVCEILGQHMQFFSVYEHHDYRLLDIIIERLAELRFPEQLNTCGLFLKHFHAFVLREFDRMNFIYQTRYLVTTMGFFSKKKVLKDKEGCSWSISCMTEQMSSFFTRINGRKLRSLNIYIRTVSKVPRAEFLQDFIQLHEFHDDDETGVAVQIADRILRDKENSYTDYNFC